MKRMKTEGSGWLKRREEKAGEVGFWDKVLRLPRLSLNVLVLVGASVAAFSLLSLVALSSIEVIGRRFFRFSTGFSEEVSGYLLVSVTFMALAYVFVKERHLAVEAVIGKVGPRGKKGLNIFRAIVALAFCVMITWYGSLLVLGSLHIGSRSGGVLRVPLFAPHSLIPIGMGILSLVILVYLIGAIKSSATSEKRTAKSHFTKGGRR
jgi:TRAP-type C4-dicarboxylate transport system permease small subunit